MSMDSIRHSRWPSKFLNQPSPSPVHSGLSSTALTSEPAVELAMSMMVELYAAAASRSRTAEEQLKPGAQPAEAAAPSTGMLGRGRNQLL